MSVLTFSMEPDRKCEQCDFGVTEDGTKIVNGWRACDCLQPTARLKVRTKEDLAGVEELLSTTHWDKASGQVGRREPHPLEAPEGATEAELDYYTITRRIIEYDGTGPIHGELRAKVDGWWDNSFDLPSEQEYNLSLDGVDAARLEWPDGANTDWPDSDKPGGCDCEGMGQCEYHWKMNNLSAARAALEERGDVEVDE